MILVFLWLTPLTTITSRCIHVAAGGIISLFSWFSSIPLYVCTTSLGIHLLMDIQVVVMAIVNSAVVNTGVRVSFWTIVLSGYMPRRGISGLHGNSIFSFLGEPPYYSPKWLSSLHSHQQCGRIPFLHTLSSICRLFIDGHSDQCEVVSHSFDLYSSSN